jgi:hypothetical protein
MLFTRFALVTCAFYLGIAILIDGAIFGMAQWKGGFAVFASRAGWLVFFCAMWLISFPDIVADCDSSRVRSNSQGLKLGHSVPPCRNSFSDRRNSALIRGEEGLDGNQ